MKSGWVTKKLGDVCELINRGIAPKYIDEGGIQVLNQKCIRDHSVNYELARRNNPELKSVPEERLIRVGDVLVNSTGTGTLGRVAQVREMPNEPTTVDTHVTIVRPKEGKFYLDFFGYALIEIEEEIKNSGAGASGQTELARDVLKNEFTISFAESLEEQQRIVAILDEVFAGIAAATANAEKNLQNARELFESTLQSVFAEKGEGWEEKCIDEVTTVINGYAFKSTDFSEKNTVNSVKITNVGVREFVTESNSNLPSGFEREYGKFKVSEGDIVIALTRSVIAGGLKVAFVPSEYDGALLNQRVAALRVNNDVVLPNFLYAYLCSSFVIEYVKKQANTLMQPNLSITDLKSMPVSLPSLDEQMRVVERLDRLSSETRRLESLYQQKLDELAELKQSTLQKAFAGELH